MLKKLRFKELKKLFSSIIFQFIFLIILIIFSFVTHTFTNLEPIIISSANDLSKFVNKRVLLNPDYIVNYYTEIREDNRKGKVGKGKVVSLGYIGYNAKDDKHFGILVDKDLTDKYESSLKAYSDFDYEKAEKLVPRTEGTVKKMDSKDIVFFRDSLESVLKEDILMFSLMDLTDEEIENLTEDELNDMINYAEDTKFSAEELDEYAEYYYIDYKEDKDYITDVIIYSSFIVVISIFILFKLIRFLACTKFTSLKEKINSDYNVKEEYLNQDFEDAINIDTIWIGREYSIFLTKKSADFIKNEDIIWVYIQEEYGYFRIGQKYQYSIVYTDKNGNQYFGKINSKKAIKVLETYKEKYPNLYIGYNQELYNILKQNFNDFYEFDKEELQISIIKKI